MMTKYPNCWSVTLLDGENYECNTCAFEFYVDPVTKKCLPNQIKNCVSETIDKNSVHRCQMCKGGLQVKSYGSETTRNEDKMDSCIDLPKSQWITGCRFYNSITAKQTDNQQIPSCALCKEGYYKSLESDTFRWVCISVNDDNMINLQCAPGKENIGTTKGTCKQCNTARDYWPNDSELITVTEFDQTCIQKFTLLTKDLHEFDYKSYIRIRGIFFIIAGAIVITINYFLIKSCLKDEDDNAVYEGDNVFERETNKPSDFNNEYGE